MHLGGEHGADRDNGVCNWKGLVWNKKALNPQREWKRVLLKFPFKTSAELWSHRLHLMTNGAFWEDWAQATACLCVCMHVCVHSPCQSVTAETFRHALSNSELFRIPQWTFFCRGSAILWSAPVGTSPHPGNWTSALLCRRLNSTKVEAWKKWKREFHCILSSKLWTLTETKWW